MSSVKRHNLKRTKLSKQGKLKCRRHKKKSEVSHKRNTGVQPKSNPVQEEEESDHGEELLQMVEKDDIEFLQNAVATHSYSLLNHIRFTEYDLFMFYLYILISSASMSTISGLLP
jgi:nucleolar complex protein 3